METTEINERVRLLPPSPDVNPKDRYVGFDNFLFDYLYIAMRSRVNFRKWNMITGLTIYIIYGSA